MNFLRERQQLVICIIAALIVSGFIFLRYLPLNNKISRIEQTEQEKLQLIEKAAVEKTKIEDLQKQRDSALELLRDYDRKIPVDRDIGGFLQKIADMMNAAELSEQLVEPGQEVKGQNLIGIPVTMRCKGRFEQIFLFYQLLQNFDRQIRIEEITLTDSGGYNGLVQMQTSAVIYYRGQSG